MKCVEGRGGRWLATIYEYI